VIVRLHLLLVAALVACGLLAVVAAGDEPMTEEDVVRMFVAGHAAEEIEREIERREPGFDLSPEMLDELRNVELPERLIRAMIRARDAQEPPPEPARTPAVPAPPEPTLRIRLNPGREGSTPTVSVRARVDPQFAAEWELGNAPEDRAFADVALFLLCSTADHVPDQWRLRSPLGRDFEAAPRHKMLEFVGGASGEAYNEGGRRIKLKLPDLLEIPLEPGVPHDLMLGLALQIAGRYRVAVADTWPAVVIGDDGLDLTARVKGRSLRTLKVRFRRDDDDEEVDDESREAEEFDRGADRRPRSP
jgi:hypothetical protein